MLFYKALN
jgi:hypothetical protein